MKFFCNPFSGVKNQSHILQQVKRFSVMLSQSNKENYTFLTPIFRGEARCCCALGAASPLLLWLRGRSWGFFLVSFFHFIIGPTAAASFA